MKGEEAANKVASDPTVEAEILEPEEVIDAEGAEVTDELEAARAEADELRDRFARLQAEWDNYRKRTVAERAFERSLAAEKLVVNLLPVVDDLERAIEHAESSDAALVEGVTAVFNKLVAILEKESVTSVDPSGQPFDATKHHAVGRTEDVTVPDETILLVYQKGYEMAGKTIRPAMVTVSSGGPRREAEGSDAE